MEDLKRKKAFISDMDGVIYHGNLLLPGVREFVDWLERNGKEYLFLTNSSERSPKELKQKLHRLGLDVGEEHFYTSALATAEFISSQHPGATAYVIGDPGLYNALYDKGIAISDVDPDYVVLGESSNYTYDAICKAVHLVQKGARLIGSNSDLTGPSEEGIVPACRAFIAPIELTTGQNAYFVGKPNPLMMRTGLRLLGVHSQEAAMSIKVKKHKLLSIGNGKKRLKILKPARKKKFLWSILKCTGLPFSTLTNAPVYRN